MTVERRQASVQDIRRILGRLDDDTLAAILALRPSEQEVMEAFIWSSKQDDVLGERAQPPRGVVAEVCELLHADEQFPDPDER